MLTKIINKNINVDINDDEFIESLSNNVNLIVYVNMEYQFDKTNNVIIYN